MTDESNFLPDLLPLNEGDGKDGEKVTPLFIGGLFGPQMLIMRSVEDEEEKDPNP